jgi:hypothetical protein
MAELNARIIPKASGTAGEVPLAGDLETAELAVNTADGTLFTKDVGGAVVTISGGGGGGAVDSVNGETGVVSLGVEDLNNVSESPISGAWVGSWEVDSLSPGQLKDPGYISTSNDNGGGGNVAYVDQATSTDYSSELSALSGGTIYFKVGNGSWTSGAVGNVTLNTSTPAKPTVLIGCVPLQTALQAATITDIVQLSNDPNGGFASAADGQVLMWADASGAWIPGDPALANLSDVVFQGPPSWNQNKSGSNLLCPDVTYYAATPSGPNNWIQISTTDVSGGNLQTWFDSWVTGDTMSVTVNGGAVMTEALDQPTPNETYCRIEFKFGTDTIFNAIAAAGPNGIVTIQNDTRPYYVSSTPSDGQILVYDAANSLWGASEQFGIKAASYSDLVGGQSVDSTTAAVVTGCTNVVTENSIYSNTAGVITISETGVYEIYGCVGATGDTANYRWTAEYDVRVDGSMVARQVGGYIRATSQSNYSDIAVNTIVPITAGQTVDFTLKRVSNVTGNATVLANTSRILIKKLL